MQGRTSCSHPAMQTAPGAGQSPHPAPEALPAAETPTQISLTVSRKSRARVLARAAGMACDTAQGMAQPAWGQLGRVVAAVGPAALHAARHTPVVLSCLSKTTCSEEGACGWMQKCGDSLLNILGGGASSSLTLATRCRCWWAVTYGLDQSTGGSVCWFVCWDGWLHGLWSAHERGAVLLAQPLMMSYARCSSWQQNAEMSGWNGVGFGCMPLLYGAAQHLHCNCLSIACRNASLASQLPSCRPAPTA